MSFPRLIRTKPAAVESTSGHEEELFLKDSAGILGSDFPNPDRVGCPDRVTLQRIASRELPLQEIGSWLKHLSICSDCFRDVSQFRRRKQQQRALTWALAGAAAVLIVVVALIWTNSKFGTNHREEAILDLRNASVSRGGESGGNPNSEALPALSRSARRVRVYLPPGAEGAYELRLIDESGTVAAITKGVGKAANALTVLQININLSRATPGTYSLLVKRGATSTIYRIQLQ